MKKLPAANSNKNTNRGNSKTAGAHVFVMGKVITNLPQLELDSLTEDDIHGMFVKLNDITSLRDESVKRSQRRYIV